MQPTKTIEDAALLTRIFTTATALVNKLNTFSADHTYNKEQMNVFGKENYDASREAFAALNIEWDEETAEQFIDLVTDCWERLGNHTVLLWVICSALYQLTLIEQYVGEAANENAGMVH